MSPDEHRCRDIVWTRFARRRLRDIAAYVARDNPLAAERLATRIVAVVEALKTHPHLGRSGTEPGTRELVIGGTPYIVVYRVHRDHVTITTVWHGAQQRSQ